MRKQPNQADDPNRRREEIRQQQLLKEKEAGARDDVLSARTVAEQLPHRKTVDCLPDEVRQRDGDGEKRTREKPRRRKRAPLGSQRQSGEQRKRKEQHAVLTLERDADDGSGGEPPARIGAFDEAQHVERGERPERKADHVGADLRAEALEHARRKIRKRRERRSKDSAAELEREQTRDVRAEGCEECRDRAQRNERVPEELRAGREKRHDRRLIDVAPCRVKTADDKVELVAEEAVVRIGDQVHDERNECGDCRNAYGH